MGCPRHLAPAPVEEDREEVASDLRRFTRLWLSPARVAPPTIDFVPVTESRDGITASVVPIRPEGAAWNTWSNGELRLFNNRAGLFMEVKLASDEAIRWIPEKTHLVLDDATVVPSTGQADELLRPLLRAALAEERSVLRGDLVARTRAAGAFRAAYLPSAPAKDLSGVAAFVLPQPERQVTRVALHLALDRGGREIDFDLTWD